MHPYYAMRAIGGAIYWLGGVIMLLNVVMTIRQAAGQRSASAATASA
jgi:cytochrome c oxidase cbb3-type subunit 1